MVKEDIGHKLNGNVKECTKNRNLMEEDLYVSNLKGCLHQLDLNIFTGPTLFLKLANLYQTL